MVSEEGQAALMAIGDWAGAKAAYKRALLERPRSGFPLYGIALSNEESGDTTAATTDYSEFLEAWKNADPTTAQVMHAKTFIAAHKPISETLAQRR
jgi:hypothetical protein